MIVSALVRFLFVFTRVIGVWVVENASNELVLDLRACFEFSLVSGGRPFKRLELRP